MISGASANYLILFYIWLIIDSRLCISCILAIPSTAAATPRAMRAMKKITMRIYGVKAMRKDFPGRKR